MFTSLDKALVALVGAIVYLLGALFDIQIAWLTSDMIQNIAVGVTPLLVWAFPNKKPDDVA
jgi:hypothetical protein